MTLTAAFEPLAALAPEWAALHASVPEAVPFAHPEWYRVWLAHYPESRAEFVAAREDGGLVGVVPVRTGDDAGLLGNPKIQDYAGLVALPGRERDVAAVALELVGRGAGRFVAWGLSEAGPWLEAMRFGASAGGWSAVEEDEARAPAAPGLTDFDAFVASLDKHDRHELRRKLRNLGAAGEVAFVALSDPEDIRLEMDGLVAMMRSSHEGKTRFLNPTMEAFFRAMAPAMAEAGLCRLWRLTLDGHCAAYLLGFTNATTTFLYNSGYDPEYAKLAVGLLSKAEAIRWTIAEGRTTFDFLRGDEEYKRRLGGEPLRVLRLALDHP